ncbi:MAG: glycosyltransferase family 2 protein [Planctomycetota bacterium]|nr:glycosyltransferase family 2 protein [Planctomycetota bacterium]
MAEKSPIPALIPFYKDQRQLGLCLDALRKQTYPVDPWVHDNSVQNLYYTIALNLLLRRAIREGQKYALVLTQDVYLRPDAMENLVKFMDEHPRCALAGLKQVLPDDQDIIVHGGVTTSFPTGVHLSGRKSLGQCAVSAKMPWTNGACIMARIDAVLDFGLMDENMKMLCSDSDWSYTARARGWEVWYCASAEAIHECGVSSKPASPQLEPIFRADLQYLIEKWVGSTLFSRLQAEFQPRLAVGKYMRV